jgi:glycosyltransferase involved in cell wall biosynthesis
VTEENEGQREAGARRPGVLMVAPLPAEPLVGGIATGVRLLLRSQLARTVSMDLFNTYRREDATRPLWQSLTYQATTIIRFAWTVARRRPPIVHIKAASYVNFYQSALYAMTARLLGRRVILQLHAGDFPQFHDGAGRVRQAIIRVALKVPHGLMALSNHWAEYFRGLSGARAIAVVPNALHTHDYVDAVPDRARFGIPDGRVALLFVGTRNREADRDKGLGELAAAVARVRTRHPELLLIVAGIAGDSEVLSSALGSAGGTWLSVGIVREESKPTLFRSVDLFALPSRFENMPNSLLEAMAAGLPSVATPVGAIPEMICDGESGFLVPIGDVEALAERIERLVADRALRRQIGDRAARVAAERFDFLLLERLMLAEYRRLAPGVERAVR